jgi:hypothetical protein
MSLKNKTQQNEVSHLNTNVEQHTHSDSSCTLHHVLIAVLHLARDMMILERLEQAAVVIVGGRRHVSVFVGICLANLGSKVVSNLSAKRP